MAQAALRADMMESARNPMDFPDLLCSGSYSAELLDSLYQFAIFDADDGFDREVAVENEDHSSLQPYRGTRVRQRGARSLFAEDLQIKADDPVSRFARPAIWCAADGTSVLIAAGCCGVPQFVLNRSPAMIGGGGVEFVRVSSRVTDVRFVDRGSSATPMLAVCAGRQLLMFDVDAGDASNLDFVAFPLISSAREVTSCGAHVAVLAGEALSLYDGDLPLSQVALPIDSDGDVASSVRMNGASRVSITTERGRYGELDARSGRFTWLGTSADAAALYTHAHVATLPEQVLLGYGDGMLRVVDRRRPSDATLAAVALPRVAAVGDLQAGDGEGRVALSGIGGGCVFDIRAAASHLEMAVTHIVEAPADVRVDVALPRGEWAAYAAGARLGWQQSK